jgi:Zn-finger nucleic acid-binding protein
VQPSAANRASGGPYRAADVWPAEPLETRCPYCGNGCPPLVRICPHCDVRLENVRCVRCFTLQPPGSFTCARCGRALELEPLLDATDAPCPRCRTPLEAMAAGAWDALDRPELTHDERIHECPRCGGMFVLRDVLAEILCRAEVSGPIPEPPRSSSPRLEPVSYIPCPLCHALMNRVNFGKISGVVVDVCKTHGTWFDAGELTRVVAFASSGGLQKTREREEAERKEAQRPKVQVPDLTVFVHSRRVVDMRLEEWRDFLRRALFW